MGNGASTPSESAGSASAHAGPSSDVVLDGGLKVSDDVSKKVRDFYKSIAKVSSLMEFADAFISPNYVHRVYANEDPATEATVQDRLTWLQRQRKRLEANYWCESFTGIRAYVENLDSGHPTFLVEFAATQHVPAKTHVYGVARFGEVDPARGGVAAAWKNAQMPFWTSTTLRITSQHVSIGSAALEQCRVSLGLQSVSKGAGSGSVGSGSAGASAATTSASGDPQFIREKKYDGQLGRRLGAGGQGDVFELVRSNGESCAIKLMPGNAANSYKHELSALMACSHPNIARVLDYGKHLEQFWITMELFSADLERFVGDRVQMVRSDPNQQYFSPPEVTDLLKGLTSALAYLHQQGIAHRDLKSKNVLVSLSSSKELIKVVLTDFGLTRELDGNAPRTMELTMGGSSGWMSPEVSEKLVASLQGRAGSKQAYNAFHADMYALGLIIHHVVTGKSFDPTATGANKVNFPFEDMKVEKLPSLISPKCADEEATRKKYTKASNLRDLLLKYDPKARLDSTEVVDMLMERNFSKHPIAMFSRKHKMAVIWETFAHHLKEFNSLSELYPLDERKFVEMFHGDVGLATKFRRELLTCKENWCCDSPEPSEVE